MTLCKPARGEPGEAKGTNRYPIETRCDLFVSEGGEFATRGHTSVKVTFRPRLSETSPKGACGVAFKALAYCPRRKDSPARASLKNCRMKSSR